MNIFSQYILYHLFIYLAIIYSFRLSRKGEIYFENTRYEYISQYIFILLRYHDNF